MGKGRMNMHPLPEERLRALDDRHTLSTGCQLPLVGVWRTCKESRVTRGEEGEEVGTQENMLSC